MALFNKIILHVCLRMVSFLGLKVWVTYIVFYQMEFFFFKVEVNCAQNFESNKVKVAIKHHTWGGRAAVHLNTQQEK